MRNKLVIRIAENKVEAVRAAISQILEKMKYRQNWMQLAKIRFKKMDKNKL